MDRQRNQQEAWAELLLSRLNGLLPDDADVQRVVEWTRIARHHGPVVLAGAGMSANAVPRPGWGSDPDAPPSVPKAGTWRDLADRLAASMGPMGESREADPLWLAELYRQAFGHRRLVSLLEDVVPHRFLSPGPAHASLVRLPWRAVLTTNYDSLIEQAFCAGEDGRHPAVHARRAIAVHRDRDLVQSILGSDSVEVIHLHGSFDAAETDELVVALEDYRRYPRTHPGMVAKVRQLLVQHPLMLVGFSATDPNFTQWMGWVSDLMGDGRHRALGVTVERPSDARSAYWNGAVDFIQLRDRTALTSFLDAVALAIPGAPGEAWRIRDDEIAKEIERPTSVPALVFALPRLAHLASQQGRPQAGGERWGRRLLDLATRRASILRHGREEAERLLARTGAPDQATLKTLKVLGAAVDVSSAPTPEEKQDIVRNAWGESWPALLAAAFDIEPSYGISPLHGGPGFHVPTEVEHLDPDGTRPEFRRIRLGLCCAAITEGGLDVVDVHIRKWLGEPRSDEERQALDDARARLHLRAGAELAADFSARDAQSLRRRGFVRTLCGRLEDAAQDYVAAAGMSGDEKEAMAEEWWTLESALIAVRRLNWPRRDGESNLAGTEDRLRQRQHALMRRNPPVAEDLLESGIAPREDLIKEMAQWVDGRAGASIYRHRWPVAGQAGRRLSEMESGWYSPWLAGRHAEMAAEMEWLGGEQVEATRKLVRFGSPRLGQLVEGACLRLKPGPLDPAVLPELLREGRWAAEWVTRLEALAHVVDRMSDDDHAVLGPWCESLARTVPPATRLAVRGGSDTEGMGHARELGDVVSGSWRYRGGRATVDEWRRWVLPLDGDSMAYRSEIAARLDELPWGMWFTNGELTAEEVDRTLAEGLEAMALRPPQFTRYHATVAGCASWLDLSGYPPASPLPAGTLPRLREGLERWLESEPQRGRSHGLQECAYVARSVESPRGEAVLREILDFVMERLDDTDARRILFRDLVAAFATASGRATPHKADRVLSVVEERLAAQEVSRGPGGLEDERDAFAIALFASTLIRRGAGEVDRAVAVLRRSLPLAGSALRPAAEAAAHWPALRPDVEGAVEAALFERVDPGEVEQSQRRHAAMAAIGIAGESLSEVQPWALPGRWVFALSAEVTSGDRQRAISACQTLGILLARRWQGSEETTWAWVLRALKGAAASTDVSLRANAIHALATAASAGVVPEELRDDIEGVLREAEHGVVPALRFAVQHGRYTARLSPLR